MNNVDFVKSLYAAFMEGRIEKILAVMAPNIDWMSNADPALLPWGGERRSMGEIREYFSELTANVEFASVTPRDFYAGDDFVLVLGHSTGRMRQSGTRFDSEWAHFFRLGGGRVVAFREYIDTHAAVQAFIGGDIHAIGLPSQTRAPRHH